jgi:signal peptidase I
VRLPVIHTKILGQDAPKRGDIMVFRYPEDPSVDYIKRVIGLPGDHISYIDKVLYVNGKKAPQTFIKEVNVKNELGEEWLATEKQEEFFGIKHAIYLNAADVAHDFRDVVVPADHYFMMGDNRDNSADSRFWGFVPDKNIVGKAVMVWMSWNSDKTNVRWKRIGTMIH